MKIWRGFLRHPVHSCCRLVALLLLFCPGTVRADWLKQLEADAVSYMADVGSPGMAMVIVKDDEVIYAGGFGSVSVDSSSAVDTDTVFMIGSTSKAFCSAQLAVLADRKRIAWQDPVRKHLPSYRMYDSWVNNQFRIEDLLCHRSGLHMYSLTMMEVLDYSSSARVWGIRFQQPVSSFRTAFAYQNCMYTSAAMLAQAVSGKSWGKSLSETIFVPLGMTRTVTSQAAVNKMDNVAVGHLHLKNGKLWPIPSDWFWNEIQDTSLAAGSVRTTARDMGRWLRMHLALGKLGSKQVVSTANMRYLHAPRVLISPWAHNTDSPYWGSVSYCTGALQYWGLSPQPFLYHDGGAMGSGSAVGMVPGANLGIAVLTNIEAGDALAAKIVLRMYQLYFGEGSATDTAPANVPAMRETCAASSDRDRELSCRVEEASAIPLRSFCGVYNNPAYGDFVVKLSEGGLVITMGPKKMTANLVRKAAGSNNFTAYLPGYPEGYEMTMPVNFKFPASGQAVMYMGPIIHDPQEVFVRKIYR